MDSEKGDPMPDIEMDFKELLDLFNKHKVRYCIVGAFAVGFHSVPRYTKDLDLLVDPDLENGRRIVAALEEFGFGSLKLAAEDFSRPGWIVALGREPVRIDLITSLSGCTFQHVWRNKRRGKYGETAIYFMGLNDLLRNKRASGRPRDIADLDQLIRYSRARGRISKK